MRVLQLPSHFTATHPTAGLPGFPAIDIFAPAGSPVASPVGGTIIKLSGRKPSGHATPGTAYGYNMYIRTSTAVYFLAHFGQRSSRVTVGTTVKRGQYLGKVADFDGATNGVTPSHIHEGYHQGAFTP